MCGPDLERGDKQRQSRRIHLPEAEAVHELREEPERLLLRGVHEESARDKIHRLAVAYLRHVDTRRYHVGTRAPLPHVDTRASAG